MEFDRYEDVRKHLVETLSLSNSLLKKISNLFISSSEELYSKIKKALELEDMNLLRESAHTLKGSAANIGGKKVQESAYALQLAAENGQKDLCSVLSDNLYRNIKHLQEILIEIAHEAAI